MNYKPIERRRPPAWLAQIPNSVLDRPYGDGRAVSGLEHCLRVLGLPRPTLLDLDTERLRRGLR